MTDHANRPTADPTIDLTCTASPVHDFVPRLTTTDWNAEWMELQRSRHAADNAAHWDERAKTYHKAVLPPSPYVREFIEYAEVQPGDSVFDMGCGTGAISIPLAAQGHDVLACDFSEGMLDVLREEAKQHHVSIATKRLAWADDWEAAGVMPKSFDVACASRSIATANLRESLAKLSGVARRRCAITLPTGSSPRVDETILTAVGLQAYLGRDFLYAFMILVQMGYRPEVRYIKSARHDTFASEQDAYASLSRMVDDAACGRLPIAQMEEAHASLRVWLTRNLVPNPNAGKANQFGEVEGAFRLREPRKVTWAHIAWDV